LNNTLGTYLSQIHEEHHDDNTRESFHRGNDEQQPSTTTGVNQQYRVGWMNKCWPCKKRHSIEPQSEENNKI